MSEKEEKTMADETPVLRDAMPATAQWQAVEPLKPMLSGRKMVDLARSGSFSVDDTTGDKMIAALEAVIDTLEHRWSALQKVGERPAMSSTATGEWVAQHMSNTANDAQGLLTQLQAAKNEFPTYIEAIKLAKKNYADRESGTKATLKNLPSADQS
ncbi:hypothetical protein [Amycolatopsis sp. PS_44_ISF1]|uniref:hypothetical protein n=1 Tax=Amycolatopsis sp. PS_44_ISF1 TaxID=2974917 RepID=UPI0028DE1351|nr:hypothetical protein [Amycolatopsis sp. PS_44_ISF1]MDT8913229.1 hypothetical protein [Amycolatopsis sp. PS_44_ISF1]